MLLIYSYESRTIECEFPESVLMTGQSGFTFARILQLYKNVYHQNLVVECPYKYVSIHFPFGISSALIEESVFLF